MHLYPIGIDQWLGLIMPPLAVAGYCCFFRPSFKHFAFLYPIAVMLSWFWLLSIMLRYFDWHMWRQDHQTPGTGPFMHLQIAVGHWVGLALPPLAGVSYACYRRPCIRHFVLLFAIANLFLWFGLLLITHMLVLKWVLLDMEWLELRSRGLYLMLRYYMLVPFCVSAIVTGIAAGAYLTRDCWRE